MAEVVTLIPKTCAYLMDDGSDHKKAEGAKKCVIKQNLMFENYKDCLFNNKTVYRSQESKLSSDWITTYPYGTDEMIIKQS